MGVIDGTPSPGPPTWVLEPHLDISVGDILAVQELDGSANITHDLCSFCRHSRRVRDASQRSGSRALTLLSPGTAQTGEGTLATQDPHSIPYPSHSNFPWGCPSPPGPLCPGLGYLSQVSCRWAPELGGLHPKTPESPSPTRQYRLTELLGVGTLFLTLSWSAGETEAQRGARPCPASHSNSMCSIAVRIPHPPPGPAALTYLSQ